MSKPQSTPRPVAVVVQTHWDREWYFTHQRFVARLIATMQQVVRQLQSGGLRYFLFDGQTAAYEDVLAHAEPALAAEVRQLAREGRILLGPWYVMADEFLVSGESLLRNLEIGMADARTAGNCQRVGYLPDTFGHIGQMPQLLRHFGIEQAVLWRGVDSPVAEFDWQAPDGSTVGAVLLTQGYYQHPLNVPDWRVALTRYLEAAAPRALAATLLLTQGGDHLLPADELPQRIEAWNASQDDYRLEQRSLEDAVTAILGQSRGRRAVIAGELRNNAQAFILPDVLSTRRYLKRLHQAAEDRLIGAIEPLLAQLQTTEAYPAHYLEQCWRLLIQQQAHDSICGCSVDAVHAEMLTRFRQLAERLDALQTRACVDGGLTANRQHAPVSGAAAVFADDSAFTLFNPLPKAFAGWHLCEVFVAGPQRAGPQIVTADGAELACELLSVTAAAEFHSPLDDFPERVPGYRYRLLVEIRLAGLEALACRLSWTGAASAAADVREAGAIENALLRVSLDAAGELVLHDKMRAVTIPRFLHLASELDAGDTYNFSPPPRPQRAAVTRFALIDCRQYRDRQEMTLRVALPQPVGLSEDRGGADVATGADTVVSSGTLRLSLTRDEPTLAGTLGWDNQARDQRTRLCLRLEQPVDHTFSDSAFDWARRPLVYAQYPAEPSRREMPPAVNPSLSAVAAGPTYVAHRAMQEYEVIEVDGAQHLALTLIRSVGWLSRRDLLTRGVGAGPDMATPEAQCLGPESFEFVIGRVRESSLEALAAAERLRRPPLLLRGHSGAWRAPLDIGNAHVQVSTLRRVGDQLELRLWNPLASPQRIALSARQWRRVNAAGAAINLPVNLLEPHAIATLRRSIA